MSMTTQLVVKAVGGRAAGEVDLAALVQASLVQLFGSIGGAIPLEFESITSGSGAEGVVTVDKRDEAKLRSALALVSSYGGKSLRLEVTEADAAGGSR
ncbi:expressed protein [Chlorella variabilis]|uniref:Expressed protein n=1 Tax=Chlorella variabilis TaxID=554065 RepID=E1ZGT1_CHLVA|nr:expressed protein [Chlorella variabilis]EFN54992.1 expressed protein [Chlorella variabilis]|eukprot:XP_005847094.1 expressed protein [Chlorella variabilis]